MNTYLRIILLSILSIVLVLNAQGPAWGVATVDDIRGMRLNPSYLGLGHGVETAVYGNFSTDSATTVDITKNHGFSMSLDGLGLGYERSNDIYRWSLGVGVGERTFSLG